MQTTLHENTKLANASSRLGERMLALGMITADQLEIALIEQRKHQQLLGQQLVRLQFVTAALVRDVLAQQHAREAIELSQVIADPGLLAWVPESFARKHRLLPLSIETEPPLLRVAMVDVFDVVAIDQLRRFIQSNESTPHQTWQIVPMLATEVELEQALDRSYGHALSLDALLQEIESGAPMLTESQATKPVVRLVNVILVDAVKQAASDIHFEPEAGFLRIRYRIDGVLWQVRSLHHRYWPALCVRLKLLAGMDIAEQRTPQDGRMHLYLCGRDIDFRASSQPTLHGENIVLRVLDRQKAILPLVEMGLPATQVQQLQRILQRPEGLLIVTGPTGSGKTTTLYSMLHHLNHPQVNIMTLEDPVEYPVGLMRQTSVFEANKVDFAQGIRAILRQDPDIILVGEIRDEESAAMAFRAAMTGHLVMTTLHTNSALAAFARLQDLGVSPALLAGNLIAVIGQRLIRRLCAHCKTPVAGADTAAVLAALHLPTHTQASVFTAKGCAHCRMTGYRGRIAVMEILMLSPTLEEMLSQRVSLSQLRQQAESEGYASLADVGAQAVITGQTSIEELRRVVHLPEATHPQAARKDSV